MKMERYGKSSTALLNQKKSFFTENKLNIEVQYKNALIYTQQPNRKLCKNCNAKLGKDADFNKGHINYIFCKNCSHLNGMHEDTIDFCEKIYADNLGKDYAKNYISEDIKAYNYRVSNIYAPKAEFLYTYLLNSGVELNDFEYLDFGSGAGYFVSALRKVGLTNIKGFDVSQYQVDFGNDMMGENVLHCHELDNTIDILSKTTAQVISMIGVLEHLQQPRMVLKTLENNSHVKYIYISVPLVSLSMYLELLSSEIFHRQLSGGHTHLYTEESIEYLCKEFDFEIVSEWWFGTDIVDLFRQISVTLEDSDVSSFVKDNFNNEFIPILDSMQLELDKKKLSSEVHLILKKC